jgi:pyridoxamine 5'-phosphate oxidase
LKKIRTKSLFTDPILHFKNWMDEAIKKNIDQPNAMVLSTADNKGNVSARYVLLKDFNKSGFIFFSNYESHKAIQLRENPKAALTFLWKSPERQVRVEGTVSKISRNESRVYFDNRPLESRINTCISPQSSIIPDRDFLLALREGFILDLQGRPPRCPENWGGYCLKPHLIEFWQGRQFRLHERIRYRLVNKKWVTEMLAP